MEINLLPKVPNTKRYRFPISVIIAIVVLTPSGFVGWQAWENSVILKAQEDVLQDLINESNYYSEQLAANREDTLLFEEYFTEFNLLKTKHLDWVLVLDGLSSKLPADGKITKLTYSGGDNIMIDAEFPSVNLGAQYIQWLNTIDWIEEIISAQSETQTGNYLVEIEIKLGLQSLLKGGDLNE